MKSATNERNNDEGEHRDSGIGRRTVLSGAGAIVAAGVLPSLAEAKKEGRHMGKRLFCEIAFLHEGVPDVPLLGYDPMSHFRIDKSARMMELRPPAGQRGLSRFVHYDGLTSLGIIPTYRPIGRTISSLDGIHPRVDGIRRLQVASEYSRPEIRTEVGSEGTVTVSVAGRSVTVEPGSTGELRLEPVTVEYHREGPRIEVEGRDGRRVTTRKAVVDSTELVPRVEVVNHGKLDVIRPTEVLE